MCCIDLRFDLFMDARISRIYVFGSMIALKCFSFGCCLGLHFLFCFTLPSALISVCPLLLKVCCWLSIIELPSVSDSEGGRVRLRETQPRTRDARRLCGINANGDAKYVRMLGVAALAMFAAHAHASFCAGRGC
jgi:hypothetical protein